MIDIKKFGNGYVPGVALSFIPDNARAAKVARAIYDGMSPQFLADRSAVYAEDASAAADLNEWIHKHYDDILLACRAAALPTNSDEVVSYDTKRGHFRGTPNGSYGYMYCAIWLENKR